MSSHPILVDAFAVVLILTGGLIAFAQKHRHAGDAPPLYYRRMIGGIMMAAFGLILAVFVTTYSLQTS